MFATTFFTHSVLNDDFPLQKRTNEGKIEDIKETEGGRDPNDNNVDKETAPPDEKDALRSLYHEVSGYVQSGIAA